MGESLGDVLGPSVGLSVVGCIVGGVLVGPSVGDLLDGLVVGGGNVGYGVVGAGVSIGMSTSSLRYLAEDDLPVLDLDVLVDFPDLELLLLLLVLLLDDQVLSLSSLLLLEDGLLPSFRLLTSSSPLFLSKPCSISLPFERSGMAGFPDLPCIIFFFALYDRC